MQMQKAIIGKKVGMTQIFDESGKVIPVTVIEAGPCVVTQKKTVENDGYSAVQLGYEDVKESKLTKPELGHLKKANVAAKKHLKEFRVECEFCDRDFAVLMFSPQNTRRDYERVAAAFAEPLAPRKTPEEPFPGILPLPAAVPIRRAVLAPQETVLLEQAQGRVCAAPLVACPPAIPIAVSGEVLTKNALCLMRYYGISSVAVVRETLWKEER